MGYNVKVQGRLDITPFPDSPEEMSLFQNVLEGLGWGSKSEMIGYNGKTPDCRGVDFDLTWNAEGDFYISHNGDEKSYDPESQVTTFIHYLNEVLDTQYMLNGILTCADDYHCIWKIHVNDNVVQVEKIFEGM